MYAHTERQVRCGEQVSTMFDIDLGTAQGDPLSCIIFDIYVDDLLQQVQQECTGIPLPIPEQAAPNATDDAQQSSGRTSAQPALKALMFADDFTALASNAAELQKVVHVCRAWCHKWRMSANIGPKKSAYMIFAPENAASAEREAHPMWGDMEIPRVQSYKYLGVMLHENCKWDEHTKYAREKGIKATYAMASVLHNKHIHLAVRRIVMQACVRSTVEHGSPVWHGTKQQLSKLEQVQYRVLKRMAGARSQWSSDVLRLEFGCRPYASWMTQRKIEYQFRIKRMPHHRLPSLVQRCVWQQSAAGKKPAMHSAQVQTAEKYAGVSVDEHADREEISYAAFKQIAAKAVRQADITHLRGCKQTTLTRYLDAHADLVEFPTSMRDYLHGPLTNSMRNKLMFKAGFAPVNHMLAKRMSNQSTDSEVQALTKECPFCDCPDETQEHFVLQCPAFHDLRQTTLHDFQRIVGQAKFRRWECLPPSQKLHLLLNDQHWGKSCAHDTDNLVQCYLSQLMRTRVDRLNATHSTTTAGTSAGARAHGSSCYG